jgi:hypothetical protein
MRTLPDSGSSVGGFRYLAKHSLEISCSLVDMAKGGGVKSACSVCRPVELIASDTDIAWWMKIVPAQLLICDR